MGGIVFDRRVGDLQIRFRVRKNTAPFGTSQKSGTRRSGSHAARRDGAIALDQAAVGDVQVSVRKDTAADGVLAGRPLAQRLVTDDRHVVERDVPLVEDAAALCLAGG